MIGLISALSVRAFANLGETYAESVARYGEPKQIDSTTNRVIWLINSELGIAAEFGGPDSTCDVIEYAMFGRAFTETEILTFIAFNIPKDQQYSEVKVAYGRGWLASNKTTFHLFVSGAGDHHVVLMGGTDERFQRAKKQLNIPADR